MLKNKIAVVTGAAGGIGLAMARLFAQNGAKVAIIDLQKDVVDKAVKSLQSLGAVQGFVGDVTDSAKMQEIFAQLKKNEGSVDILVNNAGVTRDGLLMRMKEDDWQTVMDVNLKGTFVCTQKASKIMMKQRSGVILNMASVIGIIGNAGQANYAASKGGVIAFSKSVAKEFGTRGVRCNAIAPGFIQTEMTDNLPLEMVAEYKKAIALGKLGTVEDVADLCLFLASDKAKYITGQTINVDGGLVM